MLDLKMKTLPDAVEVDGKVFKLNTDFRLWLQFEHDLKEHSNSQEPFDVTYLFKDKMPTSIDVTKLVEFSRPKKVLPRPVGARTDVISIDFDIDGDLIYSSLLQQYGIDITEVELHWHKFLALIQGISDQTMLGRVMGYRCYEKSNGKKKDVREELRRAWEIKAELTDEQQAEIDEFNSYFM